MVAAARDPIARVAARLAAQRAPVVNDDEDDMVPLGLLLREIQLDMREGELLAREKIAEVTAEMQADGAAEAVAGLLPFAAVTSNAVERELFLKNISTTFDVSVESLEADIKRRMREALDGKPRAGWAHVAELIKADHGGTVMQKGRAMLKRRCARGCRWCT